MITVTPTPASPDRTLVLLSNPAETVGPRLRRKCPWQGAVKRWGPKFSKGVQPGPNREQRPGLRAVCADREAARVHNHPIGRQRTQSGPCLPAGGSWAAWELHGSLLGAGGVMETPDGRGRVSSQPKKVRSRTGRAGSCLEPAGGEAGQGLFF